MGWWKFGYKNIGWRDGVTLSQIKIVLVSGWRELECFRLRDPFELISDKLHVRFIIVARLARRTSEVQRVGMWREWVACMRTQSRSSGDRKMRSNGGDAATVPNNKKKQLIVAADRTRVLRLRRAKGTGIRRRRRRSAQNFHAYVPRVPGRTCVVTARMG